MIKCLVWDLDNTLWQGILRENWEVVFSEGHRDLLEGLDKRGILQSIASRNDYGPVLRKLEELGIKHYFLYPQCRFGSKTDSLIKIAQALNLGIDSLGYIDDDPFELFEISYFLPGVQTYRADEYRNLLGYPEFKPGKVTREAALRREMMIARQERENAGRVFNGSREDFLKECKMKLTVRPATPADVDRIHELAFRTNQLNNMKEPLDGQAIAAYLHIENKKAVVAELTDRFGEHGIVGVCFLELEMETSLVLIKLFCISCRIEGRGIGVSFLSEVLNRIQDGFPSLKEAQCLFRPSDRNRPALMLLKLLGFKRKERMDDHSIYSLPLPHRLEKVEWLEIN